MTVTKGISKFWNIPLSKRILKVNHIDYKNIKYTFKLQTLRTDDDDTTRNE